MEKTQQLVSMIVGIVVVIIIVLLLVWLSNSTKTGNWLKSQVGSQSSGELSPEETAKVLAELQKPTVDASGKAVVAPTPTETAKILEQMNKSNNTQSGKQSSPEETAKILEQMSKPVK